ncbi:MAG: YceI family protein [Chitinophagales bacterium]|nr:YceI family protein [Chitinophagales bacterium]MDW8272787.1 YceI family protein [Chitinophagales bacterium]
MNYHYIVFSFLTLLIAHTTFAQNVYYTQKGKVHFFSKTPLEDIEATTNKGIGTLNTATKKVQAKIPIQSFEFRQKLMQEHFNENYMESDKYPYGSLDATIMEEIDFTKDGNYEITLKGILEIHGVKQPRELKCRLTIQSGEPVRAVSSFDVKLADHKIKIPRAVILNIAEVIKVDVDFELSRYTKN